MLLSYVFTLMTYTLAVAKLQTFSGLTKYILFALYLQTQGYAVAFEVDFEDFDLDVLV